MRMVLRFLCLPGAYTNAKVFAARAISDYELADAHIPDFPSAARYQDVSMLPNAGSKQAQLGPLAHELESDGFATFHFTQGEHESSAPKGFESWFGNPPNRTFFPTRYVLSQSRHLATRKARAVDTGQCSNTGNATYSERNR